MGQRVREFDAGFGSWQDAGRLPGRGVGHQIVNRAPFAGREIGDVLGRVMVVLKTIRQPRLRLDVHAFETVFRKFSGERGSGRESIDNNRDVAHDDRPKA
jgi:hypothetical protein